MMIFWQLRNIGAAKLEHGIHEPLITGLSQSFHGSCLLGGGVTPRRGAAATRLLDERFRFLALFFWTVVLFFAFSAAKAHIEANWPMAAFVTGLILVAADWERYGKAWRHAAILVLLLADFGAVLGVGYLTLPKDSPLAIANLSFNTDFLKRCFKRVGLPFPNGPKA